MAIMKETMANAIKQKKAGTFFFAKYRSDVPVKAEYKKQGINVVKYCEKFVRTGINYNHIKEVIAKKSSPDYIAPVPRANNKEWIADNRLYYNSNTDAYYVRLGVCNGKKTKVKYVAYDANGNETEFKKEYVLNSVWNKSSSTPVFDIKLDNLIAIS